MALIVELARGYADRPDRPRPQGARRWSGAARNLAEYLEAAGRVVVRRPPSAPGPGPPASASLFLSRRRAGDRERRGRERAAGDTPRAEQPQARARPLRRAAR